MFCQQSTVPGVRNSFPLFAYTQGHWFNFSTNLYALEHADVVQIWIMHINALKTQLMHKNIQMNPEKSQKFTQHSCCSILTQEKKLRAIRGNGYRFVPKGGAFPTENHHACCEKLRFVRSIYQTCPKCDKICTTKCWCRSMIACQVSSISDEFLIY